jgi:hypothetical protein
MKSISRAKGQNKQTVIISIGYYYYTDTGTRERCNAIIGYTRRATEIIDKNG